MTLTPPSVKTHLLLTMIQGQIVSPDHAVVSAHDRGLTFGDGVYEALQSYAGKLWGIEQHFQRLARSLREIQIDNVDLNQVRQWVFEAFDAVDHANCLVYFHITRGCAARAHVVDEPMEPQFLLTIKPAYDNTSKVVNGIAAISYPDIRWKRCDIKSLNLLPNVMARREAYRRKAGEAIFVDEGVVTEGAVSNAFAIIGDKLVTRPLGREILPGVTRQVVLAVARRVGLPIEERPFSLAEAFGAQELLVSGTGEEIRGIVRLDEKPIGDGKPGPWTRKIIDYFVDYTRSGASFDDLAR